MDFEEWWKKNGIEQATYAEKSAARKGWEAGTKAEREACAKAAEGFTDDRDDRKWVPGSLYHTLRRETAAVIRKRSNAKTVGPAGIIGESHTSDGLEG